MENIYTKYRDVIERAILAGIISEDDRHIYLSAIREGNDSELSEIESRLNVEKGLNSNPHFKQEKDKIFLTKQKKNVNVDKPAETTSFNSEDLISIFSGDTVENYSILDIKSPKNDSTDDSTSDVSSIRQPNVISEASQNLKSTSVFSKVVKKPVKNQVIDFNVPIYIDINKKKCKIKPHVPNLMKMTQSKISETFCAKSQNVSKWTLPDTKTLMKKKRDIPPTSTRNFVDAGALTHCINESTVEHPARKCQIKDGLLGRKISLFSPPQEKLFENQEKGPQLTAKCLNSESDKTSEHSDGQIYSTSTRRRLKVRDGIINAEQKRKTKERFSTDSEVHEQLNDKRNETRKQIYRISNVAKCRCCKCHCSCKSDYTKALDGTKSVKNNNENVFSFHGISEETNTYRKEHGRLLNVNIICQFYDEDTTKNASILDSRDRKDSSEIPVEKSETCEVDISENEKSKKKKKMQYLSRLLANMRIKKKTVQPKSCP